MLAPPYNNTQSTIGKKKIQKNSCIILIDNHIAMITGSTQNLCKKM